MVRMRLGRVVRRQLDGSARRRLGSRRDRIGLRIDVLSLLRGLIRRLAFVRRRGLLGFLDLHRRRRRGANPGQPGVLEGAAERQRRLHHLHLLARSGRGQDHLDARQHQRLHLRGVETASAARRQPFPQRGEQRVGGGQIHHRRQRNGRFHVLRILSGAHLSFSVAAGAGTPSELRHCRAPTAALSPHRSTMAPAISVSENWRSTAPRSKATRGMP